MRESEGVGVDGTVLVVDAGDRLRRDRIAELGPELRDRLAGDDRVEEGLQDAVDRLRRRGGVRGRPSAPRPGAPRRSPRRGPGCRRAREARAARGPRRARCGRRARCRALSLPPPSRRKVRYRSFWYESAIPCRRMTVATGLKTGALALVLTLAIGTSAAAQEDGLIGPYDGTIPFNCELQNVGTGTAFPHPAADPFCVEFDKTNQNVTDFGIVDFALQEPTRVAAAVTKCFYFQRDHWTGSIVQGSAPELWHWDGDYWFDIAAGRGRGQRPQPPRRRRAARRDAVRPRRLPAVLRPQRRRRGAGRAGDEPALALHLAGRHARGARPGLRRPARVHGLHRAGRRAPRPARRPRSRSA